MSRILSSTPSTSSSMHPGRSRCWITHMTPTTIPQRRSCSQTLYFFMPRISKPFSLHSFYKEEIPKSISETVQRPCTKRYWPCSSLSFPSESKLQWIRWSDFILTVTARGSFLWHLERHEHIDYEELITAVEELKLKRSCYCFTTFERYPWAFEGLSVHVRFPKQEGEKAQEVMNGSHELTKATQLIIPNGLTDSLSWVTIDKE